MTESDAGKQETSEDASLSQDSFISYSLNFEDVILHRLFPVSQTGFYVDVGAGHPRFENDMYRALSDGAGTALISSRITAFTPNSCRRGLGTLIFGSLLSDSAEGSPHLL